jgi:hypothetical protein
MKRGISFVTREEAMSTKEVLILVLAMTRINVKI